MLKNRLLMVFLIVAILVFGEAIAESDIASGTCGADGDNMTWTWDENGTLTISGTGEMASMRSSCPWSQYFSDMKSLVIEAGVTHISDYAFSGNYPALESVTFMGGGISFGYYAFEGCNNIKNVYTPTLEDWLSMDFPNPYSNPMEIASNPNFYIGGELLEHLIIPEGTTAIPRVAFINCGNLKSVYLPEGLQEIGIGAFRNCSALTKLEIPASVERICSGAFRYCDGLTAVEIPEGVVEIGEGAFNGCKGLKSISLPESLTVLEGGAFQDCEALERISIPRGVTSIESYTFQRCSALADVQLHDDIVNIGMYAFYYCTALEEIDLPDACEKIQSYAFEGCSGLKRLVLPQNLQTVGTEAFAYCTALRDITVTGTNVQFTAYAFSGCASIQSLLFLEKETVSPGDRYAFTTYYPTVYCYAGSNAYNWAYAYGYDTVLIDGKSIIPSKVLVLPASTKSIAQEAFCGNTAYSVVLPEGCTSVGSRAFADNPQLVTIYMPDSVSSIDEDAFSGSGNVTFICQSVNEALTYAKAKGLKWIVKNINETGLG